MSLDERPLTTHELRQAGLNERMQAFNRAYCALPPEQQAHVDEQIERLVTYVKQESKARYGKEIRFSPSNAMEVFGMAVIDSIMKNKYPGK